MKKKEKTHPHEAARECFHICALRESRVCQCIRLQLHWSDGTKHSKWIKRCHEKCIMLKTHRVRISISFLSAALCRGDPASLLSSTLHGSGLYGVLICSRWKFSSCATATKNLCKLSVVHSEFPRISRRHDITRAETHADTCRRRYHLIHVWMRRVLFNICNWTRE